MENDASEFSVLPKGDYTFAVTGFESGKLSGSEKMWACNNVPLTLKIESEQGMAKGFADLILHERMEWKLS